MQKQVSPAVLVIVIIVVLAILALVWFLVFGRSKKSEGVEIDTGMNMPAEPADVGAASAGTDAPMSEPGAP